MNSWRVIVGDALERLRELEDGSVQTCVTSPPYFGLRDYATKGQLGLEATPDEYVARLVEVFREVRRVLRDDGTLWLNLGDSYASSPPGNKGKGIERYRSSGLAGVSEGSRYLDTLDNSVSQKVDTSKVPGCKPKDLLGIPWMVAFALRQPYYAGTITNELDRIWLAAMIDAEGCVYIHKRKAGKPNGQGYERKNDSYGSGMEISNTSRAIVERVQAITGRGSISVASMDERRRQPLYRWNLRTNECRDVLREVYPYLVAKQHQARIAVGCPSSGERAGAAHEALKILHAGGLTDVDFPEPPSMLEPGWYLRSDCIWSKPNPMPESVTDRPTKSHEYVFLLSKGPRYFYDSDSIREDFSDERMGNPGAYDRTAQADKGSLSGQTDGGFLASPAWNANGTASGRNKRSVWTVATQPFSWRKNARRVRVELDDVDDGTERITSRDCPVHGDRPAPAPTAPDDGREVPAPSGSPGSDARHDQGPLDGFAPTDPHPGPSPQDESLGSPAQRCAPAATTRSTESRRTDPVPATILPCTPSAETLSRTDDTSGSHDSVEPRPDTLGNRTLSDGSDGHRQSRTLGGIAHKSVQQDASACTCRYYRLDETDHFAVFPPKLIEPCVKAGSAEDACGVCGAPWQRVVEREAKTDYHLVPHPSEGARAAFPGGSEHQMGQYRSHGDSLAGEPPRTVGFKPSCDHQDKTGTSVVLDPFSGAGTTGLVATRLGRSYIGIELNPTYAEMSRERIRDDQPLFNYLGEVV